MRRRMSPSFSLPSERFLLLEGGPQGDLVDETQLEEDLSEEAALDEAPPGLRPTRRRRGTEQGRLFPALVLVLEGVEELIRRHEAQAQEDVADLLVRAPLLRQGLLSCPSSITFISGGSPLGGSAGRTPTTGLWRAGPRVDARSPRLGGRRDPLGAGGRGDSRRLAGQDH